MIPDPKILIKFTQVDAAAMLAEIRTGKFFSDYAFFVFDRAGKRIAIVSRDDKQPALDPSVTAPALVAGWIFSIDPPAAAVTYHSLN